MERCPDHPDVACALRTGFPSFTPPENPDTPESRRDYLEEHFHGFLDWLSNGDQDVLDRFFTENGWDYKNWLN